MTSSSSPFSLVQLRGLGGAYGRVPNDATAFAHRDRNYFVAVIGLWLDPTEDAAPHEAWTAALWDELRPEAGDLHHAIATWKEGSLRFDQESFERRARAAAGALSGLG